MRDNVDALNLAVKEQADGIEAVSEQLALVESELNSLAKTVFASEKNHDGNQAKEKLEALLHRQFELEQEKIKSRVKVSVLKIQLVELHRMIREQRRDAIIEERLLKLPSR